MPAQIVIESGCYQVVCDEQIEQGDLFNDLYLYVQRLEQNPTEHAIEHAACGIVLSQSCDHDLAQGDSQALLCQVFTLEQLVREQGAGTVKGIWERARRGYEINYHPLVACEIENFARSASLVNFREPFNVHLDALQQRCRADQPRLRLIPPYREQLAQQFARKVMRVALPDNFPEWKNL
jgi:hypothetical protein